MQSRGVRMAARRDSARATPLIANNNTNNNNDDSSFFILVSPSLKEGLPIDDILGGASKNWDAVWGLPVERGSRTVQAGRQEPDEGQSPPDEDGIRASRLLERCEDEAWKSECDVQKYCLL
mmetsp:Transcript_36627/g.66193  ORF Transcript_36627/g.66193 Transcript_36627/m.66193 type:complete len:121 (+) Transcript_36627:191-553(+)